MAMLNNQMVFLQHKSDEPDEPWRSAIPQVPRLRPFVSASFSPAARFSTM